MVLTIKLARPMVLIIKWKVFEILIFKAIDYAAILIYYKLNHCVSGVEKLSILVVLN